MSAADDPWDLRRFVTAQDRHGSYDQALAELRAGRKQSHWIWFVFPQAAGLGHSPAAVTYAVSSVEEAREYLRHPVLGDRLRGCARVVADSGAGSAEELLGGIDALKLRSSMTLFSRAAPDEPVFVDVLDRFYEGVPDPATERLLDG